MWVRLTTCAAVDYRRRSPADAAVGRLTIGRTQRVPLPSCPTRRVRSGASQQVLRHEFGFGGVANPVVESASHGFGDGADGFAGLPAVAEAACDLEMSRGGSECVQVLFGDRSGTDQLGEMAALLHEIQGGPEELRSHRVCRIQFEVEAARDLPGGARVTDLVVDLFGLVEATCGGRNHSGVAAEAFPSAEPGECAGFVGEVGRHGVRGSPDSADWPVMVNLQA